LGRFASDGSYHSGGIRWFFADHEIDVFDFVFDVLFNEGVRITVHNQNGLIVLMTSDHEYRENYGRWKLKEQVPHHVRKHGERLRGYLAGFFDGDGGWDNTGAPYISQSEDRLGLIYDISLLLNMVGLSYFLYHYPPALRLRVHKESVTLFQREVGFLSMRKRDH